MRQLMRQQPPPCRAFRRVLARPEDHIAAYRERPGLQVSCGLAGPAIRMHPHAAEIHPKPRLEKGPNRWWQGLTSASYRMEICGDFRGAFRRVSGGVFGLGKLAFLLFLRLCGLALEQGREARRQRLALNSFFLLAFRTKASAASAGGALPLHKPGRDFARRPTLPIHLSGATRLLHSHHHIRHVIGFLFVFVAGLADA
jgi:hypothetical protein